MALGACKGIKQVKAEVRRGGKGERNGGGRARREREERGEGGGETELDSSTEASTLCNRRTTSGISCLRKHYQTRMWCSRRALSLRSSESAEPNLKTHKSIISLKRIFLVVFSFPCA